MRPHKHTYSHLKAFYFKVQIKDLAVLWVRVDSFILLPFIPPSFRSLLVLPWERSNVRELPRFSSVLLFSQGHTVHLYHPTLCLPAEACCDASRWQNVQCMGVALKKSIGKWVPVQPVFLPGSQGWSGPCISSTLRDFHPQLHPVTLNHIVFFIFIFFYFLQ